MLTAGHGLVLISVTTGLPPIGGLQVTSVLAAGWWLHWRQRGRCGACPPDWLLVPDPRVLGSAMLVGWLVATTWVPTLVGLQPCLAEDKRRRGGAQRRVG